MAAVFFTYEKIILFGHLDNIVYHFWLTVGRKMHVLCPLDNLTNNSHTQGGSRRFFIYDIVV